MKRSSFVWYSFLFTELSWSKTEWIHGCNQLERRYQQHSTSRSERWWYGNPSWCSTSFQAQSTTCGASDSATAYARPTTADGECKFQYLIFESLIFLCCNKFLDIHCYIYYQVKLWNQFLLLFIYILSNNFTS